MAPIYLKHALAASTLTLAAASSFADQPRNIQVAPEQHRYAPCHGSGGRGDGPIAPALYPGTPDPSVMASHYPDGALAWKIATGRNFMPGWKDVLTEEQIWDIVNYLRVLARKN